MKLKFRMTARERWVLTFAPALAIIGLYFFYFSDSVNAELERQKQREAAAHIPLPPPTPSAGLTAAKKALEDLKRDIADRDARIAKYETQILALPKNGDGSIGGNAPAYLIEHVETIFERRKILPLVSEPATSQNAGNQAPAALVGLLTGKEGEQDNAQKGPRIWHFIFSDQIPRFELALKDLTAQLPGVLPLSVNLVYNPDNDGETRLLELWLTY